MQLGKVWHQVSRRLPGRRIRQRELSFKASSQGWGFLLALIAIGGAWITASVTYKLGVAQSAAEYIKILGDRAAPASAKTLALSAMLEKDLVDADILFDAAYALEDQYKSRMTLQLLYLVADRHIRTRSPIGYVDHPLEETLAQEEGFYRIRGWALDESGVDGIQLLADGNEIREFPPKTFERADIARVFSGLGDERRRLNSGFTFEIPESAVSGKSYHVTVRIWNRNGRFRDIFSRRVNFAPLTR